MASRGEAGGDLRGAHRAVADHDVLDGDQGHEQHEADYIISADHELAEGLDHPAGGLRAFVAMQQDAAAGGQIER